MKTIKKTWELISHVSKIDKKGTGVLIGYSILEGVYPSISILITKEFVSSLELSLNSNRIQVTTALIVLLFLQLLFEFLMLSSSFHGKTHKLKIEKQLSLNVINATAQLKVDDFENSETYDLIMRADRDGKSRIYLVFDRLRALLRVLITMSVVSFIVIQMNIVLGIIVLIPPLVSVAIESKIGRIGYKNSIEKTPLDRRKHYLNFLMTNDIACKEIKLNNASGYLIGKYEELADKLFILDNKVNKKRRNLSQREAVLNFMVFSGLIAYIVMQASKGVGDIAEFLVLFNSVKLIQSNLGSILLISTETRNNLLYTTLYFQLLKRSVSSKKHHEKSIGSIKSLEFKDVSFTYRNSQTEIIKNVSFKFEAGDKVIIMGNNGSGKTTLIKLICGFYDSFEGEILVNGLNVNEIDKNQLFGLLSCTFQDYNRYEMSIRENLTISKFEDSNNNQKIKSCLEVVSLDKFVEGLEDGVDTQLGSWFDGIHLSIGQYQKLALSRNMFKDVSVKIFDEPTASLDSKSTQNFCNYFSKDRSTIDIVVTHKDRDFIGVSAKRYMMEDGYLTLIDQPLRMDNQIHNQTS